MTTRSAAALLALATLLPVLAGAAITKLQAQHSAVTRVRAVRSSYHWTISNYSLYRNEPGDVFESPTISTYDEDVKLNWTILVYPSGSSANETDGSFGVYLVYVDGELDAVRVRYTIHLLDADDEAYRSVDLEQMVEPGTGAGVHRLAGTAEILDPANRLLPDDELRVFVEFVAFVGERSFSNDCRRAGEPPPYTAHFERYLGNFEYSDLTLVVDNVEVRAHRVVLASRSRVFDEIFKNYGTGRTMLKFTIEDFGAPIVAEALGYMYVGKIGALTAEEYAELLSLAYKYDIDGLKDAVAYELCLALDLDPEEKAKAMEEIEYDAIETARRLPVDAQKACSIVPIDLSKVYAIE